MTIWKTPISLEELTQRGAKTMAEHLGIVFTEIGEDFLIATMPVDERTIQPLGIMHGGASCVLAETVGSTAGNIAVDQKEHYCVGLSIYTQHLRSVREGKVIGVATALHLGRSTQIWNIDISNIEQQLISTTRLTMAVLSRK
jgi:1,4-dihydroxy-2-naphthoyl-CoA hydrolase